MSANLVTVALADRALSFRLPDGATFTDLADGLAHLDESSLMLPVAFYLKIDMSRGTVLPHLDAKCETTFGQPVLPNVVISFNRS